jgi:putative flippase GtrA
MNSLRPLSRQIAKYLMVGAFTNSLAYGFYILLTSAGTGPITGMSIVFILASASTFTANRNWTFKSETSLSRSGIRFILCQILGYATNLILLMWLYYGLEIPHQAAQIMSIGIVAIVLFLLNRYFVFD